MAYIVRLYPKLCLLSGLHHVVGLEGDGGVRNQGKGRYLSKTYFIEVVYLWIGNTKPLGYFWNSKKNVIWTGLLNTQPPSNNVHVSIYSTLIAGVLQCCVLDCGQYQARCNRKKLSRSTIWGGNLVRDVEYEEYDTCVLILFPIRLSSTTCFFNGD